MAVIVSEETGRISLAIEGRIETGVTPDTLRARLRQLLLVREARPREKRGLYD